MDVFCNLGRVCPQAHLPEDYVLDGKSPVPLLTGEKDRHHDWIFSYIASARMLRDHRWLLEAVDEREGLPRGRFYDCGSSRKGYGYKNVTESKDVEVLAARERFDKLLEKLPPLDPKAPRMEEALARYDTMRKHPLQKPAGISVTSELFRLTTPLLQLQPARGKGGQR
ncbi:hypothetical protein MYX78_05020 [Acidobacteria bacterium AH-259-G07]|nr:hypothetical protein [Acidobacteria bacterium AH-259-G07]